MTIDTVTKNDHAALAASAPLTSERDRFLVLFDQLVEHSMAYVARVDAAQYATVPIDTPVMFLGARVNTINIGGLVRHVMLAEAHWFESLATMGDGSVIPFPNNAAALAGVPNGQSLLDSYRRSHEAGMARVASLTPADLAKTVSFAKRRYTGMGLLWSIHGHHGFHVGQIDLLMRQMNVEPPEYMEWPRAEGVIG